MPSDVLSAILGSLAGYAGGRDEATTAKEAAKAKAKALKDELANRTGIANIEAGSRTNVANIETKSAQSVATQRIQAERDNLHAQLTQDTAKYQSAHGLERDRLAEDIRKNTASIQQLDRQLDIEQQKANTEQAFELGTGPGSKGMKAGKTPADLLQENTTKLMDAYLSGGGDPNKLGEFITKTYAPVYDPKTGKQLNSLNAIYLHGQDRSPESAATAAAITGSPNMNPAGGIPPGIEALISSFGATGPAGVSLGTLPIFIGAAYGAGIARQTKPIRKKTPKLLTQ